MKRGLGWVISGAMLLAAPAVGAKADPQTKSDREAVASRADERAPDAEELRADFFRLLAQLLGTEWEELRGTIEPAASGTDLSSSSSGSCSDGLRGTVEPGGCG